MKKSDRNLNQKEFNPKADKAKIKAEHNLQKAASSTEDESSSVTGGL